MEIISTRGLLVSPFGFLIGVSLGALGGGGSILAVPVLVLVAGQTPSGATSTSLLVVGIAALAGAHGHWRRGRVRVRTGLVFGAVGVVGSLAGSAVNRRLDGDVLLLGFAVLMLVAAWRIVTGCPSCTRSGEAIVTDVPGGGGGGAVRTQARPMTPQRVAAVAAAGTAVGFLTGLFGVGGGFVIVPALALVLKLSMPEAIGTSLLIIAVNCASGLAARAGAGTIDWAVAVPFTLAAVAGVASGRRVADRLPAATMQRSFAGLLVVLALATGLRSLLAIV